MINQPAITLKLVEYSGSLEEILRKYGNFLRIEGIFGFYYRLFNREEPSLINFFTSNMIEDLSTIAVASYDESANKRILSELVKKTGVRLVTEEEEKENYKKRPGAQEAVDAMNAEIRKMHVEEFSNLVLS